MRAVVGILSLGLLGVLACSSGPSAPDPNSQHNNQNPPPQPPKEPDPVPLYQQQDYPQSTGTGYLAGQVAADYTWDAFLPGAPAGQTGKISLHDLFDPDGTRGINAVLIITSAEWCGACQAEAATLEGEIKSKYGSQGVLVFELMIEDTSQSRVVANVKAAADRWRSKFGLVDMAVGIDPSFHFAMSGTNGLPVNIVLDPRTMTTKYRSDGASAAVDTQIASLVSKNKLQ